MSVEIVHKGKFDETNIDPERPLVTLALFAYNQEKYIAEAVGGALAQTYSPLEIIVSDDCSTDRTFEIIEDHVGTYRGPHTLKVNRNSRNLGIVEHLNFIHSLIQGSWLVVGAGDDISHRNRVEIIMDAVKTFNHKPKAVFSFFTEFKIKKEIEEILDINVDIPSNELKISTIGHHRVIKGMGYVFPGSSWAYHRDCWEIFGKIPQTLNAEDLILPYRASLLGEIIKIPSILLGRRICPQSLGQRNGELTITQASKKRVALVSAIMHDAISAAERGLIPQQRIYEYLSRLHKVESRLSYRNFIFSSLKHHRIYQDFCQILRLFLSGDFVGLVQGIKIVFGQKFGNRS